MGHCDAVDRDCGLTFELTGPEQGDGICARVFASANSGTLCRVRFSEWLGLSGSSRVVAIFGNL